MKALKTAIIILGPIVLIAGIIYVAFFSNKGPLPNTVTLADITTGEIVRKSRDSFNTLPANNDEGQAVLYPVYQNEETGEYYFGDRLRALFEQMAREGQDIKVDLETMRVLSPQK